MVILADSPLARDFKSRAALTSREASVAGGRLVARQEQLKATLAARQIPVVSATHTLLNAVYVFTTRERAMELAKLPGVARVARDLPIVPALNRALPLVNAAQAWSVVGGYENAGREVKIGVLDTGIDQTHPGFQDSSLPIPDGFPKCEVIPGAGTATIDECSYTTRKVIVARSYVRELEYGEEPDYSRPDDRSPRDRVGHGTAVAMIAAGVTSTSPIGDITGVAPKAYLGNYKIFGSPGVNDITFTSVVIHALEDAVSDGMDIVTLSLKFPALWGPNDVVPTCYVLLSDNSPAPGGTPCDPWADAVQNAVGSGLTVVAAAGDESETGQVPYPSLNSIQSPGSAPDAITVGAVTNAHILRNSVRLTGPDVPDLQNIMAVMGDGPRLSGPFQAPLVDVTTLGDSGTLCSAVASHSMDGMIALVKRGDCTFATKVINAQNAGAAAVLLYQVDQVDTLFPPAGLALTGRPLFFIGNSDGNDVKDQLAGNAGQQAILDPKLDEFYDYGEYGDYVAPKSSYGPAIGSSGIKPEVVAPGTELLTATQNFDPNSDMFDPSRYIVANGTSFAVPMVAGAAAIAKGQHPQWGPEQLKSAVVNTSTLGFVAEIDSAGNSIVPPRVVAVGAGKLDAQNAAKTTLTVTPSTLSFGDLSAASFAQPPEISLFFTNFGASALSLSVDSSYAGASVSVTPQSLALQPGQQVEVKVQITGAKPAAGYYQGDIVVTGADTPIRVPYMYVVSDQIPADAIPLQNYDFAGLADGQLFGGLPLKVVDKFGAPVAGFQVTYSVLEGGGQYAYQDQNSNWVYVNSVATYTDSLGIADPIYVFLGPIAGPEARNAPSISAAGIINAADGTVGQGLQPGSYISIYGSFLADITQAFSTPYLPLSIAGVSVSFDETYEPGSTPQSVYRNTGISVPARFHFVSPGQINVQIPWEFMGKPTAYVKVSIGDFSSAVVAVNLNDYSPAIFPHFDEGSGSWVAAALDGGYNVIGSTNPAKHTGNDSDFIQLYCNGLGPVSNTPESGEATQISPFSTTLQTPAVTVGGVPVAKVAFSGLTPTNVGLYQLNVVLAADTPSGKQPVVITVNGISSKVAYLFVQ